MRGAAHDREHALFRQSLTRTDRREGLSGGSCGYNALVSGCVRHTRGDASPATLSLLRVADALLDLAPRQSARLPELTDFAAVQNDDAKVGPLKDALAGAALDLGSGAHGRTVSARGFEGVNGRPTRPRERQGGERFSCRGDWTSSDFSHDRPALARQSANEVETVILESIRS